MRVRVDRRADVEADPQAARIGGRPRRGSAPRAWRGRRARSRRGRRGRRASRRCRAPSARSRRWSRRRAAARRRPGPNGISPRPALSPNRPQQAAGMRIEPPPSLAPATGTMPAATAAAAPPEEPPGVRPRSQGLRAGPKRSGSVTPLAPNSGVLVLPKITRPASSQRCTTVACAGVGVLRQGAAAGGRRQAGVVLAEVLDQERDAGERSARAVRAGAPAASSSIGRTIALIARVDLAGRAAAPPRRPPARSARARRSAPPMPIRPGRRTPRPPSRLRSSPTNPRPSCPTGAAARVGRRRAPVDE